MLHWSCKPHGGFICSVGLGTFWLVFIDDSLFSFLSRNKVISLEIALDYLKGREQGMRRTITTLKELDILCHEGLLSLNEGRQLRSALRYIITHNLKLDYDSYGCEFILNSAKSPTYGLTELHFRRADIELLANFIGVLEDAEWNEATAVLDERFAQFETRLKTVEKQLDELMDIEFEHYLKLFQEKIPDFNANGIELTIQEAERRVIYQNGDRRPITYDINRAGYEAALRALNNARRNRRKQPIDEDVRYNQKLTELTARAKKIGNGLQLKDGYLWYFRNRGRINGIRSLFVVENALDPNRKPRFRGLYWCFDKDELDEVERFIAHDEAIYCSNFPEERPDQD